MTKKRGGRRIRLSLRSTTRERPRRLEPPRHRPPDDCIHLDPRLPDPRRHFGVVAAPARRVDVDTADHIVTVEDRIGETGAVVEVFGVPYEVFTVAPQRHLYRPRLRLESRSRPDVVDTRLPRGVIAIIVFWTEGLQPKPIASKGSRHFEVRRDEGRCHGPNLPVAVVRIGAVVVTVLNTVGRDRAPSRPKQREQTMSTLRCRHGLRPRPAYSMPMGKRPRGSSPRTSPTGCDSRPRRGGCTSRGPDSERA